MSRLDNLRKGVKKKAPQEVDEEALAALAANKGFTQTHAPKEPEIAKPDPVADVAPRNGAGWQPGGYRKQPGPIKNKNRQGRMSISGMPSDLPDKIRRASDQRGLTIGEMMGEAMDLYFKRHNIKLD